MLQWILLRCLLLWVLIRLVKSNDELCPSFDFSDRTVGFDQPCEGMDFMGKWEIHDYKDFKDVNKPKPNTGNYSLRPSADRSCTQNTFSIRNNEESALYLKTYAPRGTKGRLTVLLGNSRVLYEDDYEGDGTWTLIKVEVTEQFSDPLKIIYSGNTGLAIDYIVLANKGVDHITCLNVDDSGDGDQPGSVGGDNGKPDGDNVKPGGGGDGDNGNPGDGDNGKPADGGDNDKGKPGDGEDGDNRKPGDDDNLIRLNLLLSIIAIGIAAFALLCTVAIISYLCGRSAKSKKARKIQSKVIDINQNSNFDNFLPRVNTPSQSHENTISPNINSNFSYATPANDNFLDINSNFVSEMYSNKRRR